MSSWNENLAGLAEIISLLQKVANWAGHGSGIVVDRVGFIPIPQMTTTQETWLRRRSTDFPGAAAKGTSVA